MGMREMRRRGEDAREREKEGEGDVPVTGRVAGEELEACCRGARARGAPRLRWAPEAAETTVAGKRARSEFEDKGQGEGREEEGERERMCVSV